MLMKPCRHRCLLTVMLMMPALVACNSEKQTPKDLYSITVDRSELLFTPDGKGITFTLTTNSQWEINTSADWLTFSEFKSESAARNTEVTIFAEPYEVENSSRAATVSIKCGDITTDAVVRSFISITQEGPVVERSEPGIYTLSDLTALGEAIAAATEDMPADFSRWMDSDGVIYLRNDIDAGDTPLPLMGGQTTDNGKDGAFTGVFDGQNHTISGVLESNGNPIVALFTRLAPEGIIRNLNVDADVTNDYEGGDVQKHAAAIVGFSLTSAGSRIENCTSSGHIEVSGTEDNPRVGGIAAYGRCDIIGCSNYADIVSNSTRTGGITGAGGNNVSIINCINNGDITVNCDNSPQTGGIIGQQNKQMIEDCENYGSITVTGGKNALVGGIVGDGKGSGAYIGAEGAPCVNYGTVTLVLSGTASEPGTLCGVGGIAGGIEDNVPVSDCSNEGSVRSRIDHQSPAAGGIIGVIKDGKTPAVADCSNTEAATVVSAANAGGIIGQCYASAVNVTGCSNSGAVSALENALTVPAFFGNIVGSGSSVVLTGCIYGGTVNGTPGTGDNAIGK